MISKKEVLHIANLARIKLSQKEVREFQRELSSILDYVKKLKKIDISKKEPFFYPLILKNITREDKIKETLLKTRKKIISLFPKRERNYLKVKAIL